MNRIAICFYLLLSVCIAHGQKAVIDSTAISNWPSVHYIDISADGRYVLYETTNTPVKGARLLTIMDIQSNWKRDFTGARSFMITKDSRWLMLINAGDSLCQLRLGEDVQYCIPQVLSYDLNEGGFRQLLAYQKKTAAKEFILRPLNDSKELRIAGVVQYQFNKTGSVLLILKESADSSKTQVLQWLQPKDDQAKTIWEGQGAGNFIFDPARDQLAFTVSGKTPAATAIWYYKSGMDTAAITVAGNTPGVDTTMVMYTKDIEFSKDGLRLFFQMSEKKPASPPADAVKVDVWNYKDREIQSAQLNFGRPKRFQFVKPINQQGAIRLQFDDEEVMGDRLADDQYLVVTRGNPYEAWWNPAWYSTFYCVSTIDGSRRCIQDRQISYDGLFPGSPGCKWLVYFESCPRVWHSFEITTGKNRNISQSIPVPLYDEKCYEQCQLPVYRDLKSVGIAGWLRDDSAVLIYDTYDIWQVDPLGKKKPINLTGGYGRTHHIKFRLVQQNVAGSVGDTDTLLLTAFNTLTKANGFYYKQLSKPGPPEKLVMEPVQYFIDNSQMYSDMGSGFVRKASNAKIWVVSRKSEKEAENLYWTGNFRTFHAITDNHPQRNYRWLSSELIRWKIPGGQTGEGILYKPEDFDPQKRYPVIFNYYEKRSDELHEYIHPEFTAANINIPWFVSRGYLVFIPNIYYRIGHPGKSSAASIISAAQYLSGFSFVDSKHMGVQGHSFGGYETNYLITQTSLFAAAMEAAGPSDYISYYNGLMYGIDYKGSSMQFHPEIGQGRMGVSLWQRPDLYIENSPVLGVDRIRTPLLMMHNKKDGSVQFSQAIEMFTAMRRMGKKVWLLQYDEGDHGIGRDRDARDFTIRITQFFDHYLKGAPAPVWMTRGIPARFKGFMTGYEIDSSMQP